jgi:hypothetical protein
MSEATDMWIPKRSPISPAHFFSKDDEKTKLNWFLFEFARELECFIRQRTSLCDRLNRKGVDSKAGAGFCIHYAKHTKSQVLDRVSGRIANVRIGYEEIEVYFPQIGDALVDEILTTAAQAWDSQTDACTLCPTRCISEKERMAPMFDDPDHWD